ncbi:MAG: acetylornithine/succinylornithine family transaminase [Planctomycetota bacterium]|jgi:predicted acetylornithine/succinylornithine family transaminase
MTTQEILDLFDKCVIPNYPRQPIVITRAAGSEMWDLDGKRYLDLFPGWGCALLGHCHPRIVEAVRDQVGRLIHMDNIFYTVEQGRLAELIHQHSFGGKSFFSNSGAEANEGAIKLARRHTPPERYKIITMEKSFHGRTLAAMTATGQSKAHQGFGPLMPGFVYVPFNDIDAVAQAIDNETAAVMVEPIQGEGGINVPDDNYLPALRELCDENQMLLILDEVQTGCGRTGKWFGYQHYPIEPDIITLAKALGNGAPIGAIVAQPEVADSLTPGTHASTFGANPLVVSAAIAVLETIEEENLLEKVQQISAYIFQKAGEIQQQFTFIEEVRGRGLMIAIELALPGAPIVTTALEKGLRINCTQETVLRMLPAMTLTDQQVDEAFEILTDSIKEAEKKLVKT